MYGGTPSRSSAGRQGTGTGGWEFGFTPSDMKNLDEIKWDGGIGKMEQNKEDILNAFSKGRKTGGGKEDTPHLPGPGASMDERIRIRGLSKTGDCGGIGD